jgi:hypothetical protein
VIINLPCPLVVSAQVSRSDRKLAPFGQLRHKHGRLVRRERQLAAPRRG